MSTILKSQQKRPLRVINFKVTKEQRQKIERNAKKFAGGNVSEWIRYAAMNLEPMEKDLVVKSIA